MQYNQPYGAAANASYINGDPSIGRRGSIPPAGAVEYPQREIIAVIEAAGITPSNADLSQLLKAITAMIAAHSGPGDNVGQTALAIVAIANKFNPGDAGMALGTVYTGPQISGPGDSFPPGTNSKLYAFGGPNSHVIGLGAGDYSQPEIGVLGGTTLPGTWKLTQWAVLTTESDTIAPYNQHTNYHLTFQRVS